MKFHSFQLRLAATEGREVTPKMRKVEKERTPSNNDDSPHLEEYKFQFVYASIHVNLLVKTTLISVIIEVIVEGA